MSTAFERAIAAGVIDHAAVALASAEGYDWDKGKPAVQNEYRRQARVAVGACIEYLIKHNIQVKA